jgi:hypothetical protein
VGFGGECRWQPYKGTIQSPARKNEGCESDGEVEIGAVWGANETLLGSYRMSSDVGILDQQRDG